MQIYLNISSALVGPSHNINFKFHLKCLTTVGIYYAGCVEIKGSDLERISSFFCHELHSRYIIHSIGTKGERLIIKFAKYRIVGSNILD